uniref:IlGF domain-containing protein n=1 Tax=Caenorhabditis tropicalis TaxID=1561998 RepID=A0A1I7TSN7_9PELO
MNSFSLLFVFLFVFGVSAVPSFEINEYENPETNGRSMGNDLQSMYLYLLKLSKPSHHIPKYRAERSSYFKTCGQKIVEYTRQVCGSLDSQANTEQDISTKCCSSKCSDDYIRRAMCPEKQKS